MAGFAHAQPHSDRILLVHHVAWQFFAVTVEEAVGRMTRVEHTGLRETWQRSRQRAQQKAMSRKLEGEHRGARSTADSYCFINCAFLQAERMSKKPVEGRQSKHEGLVKSAENPQNTCVFERSPRLPRCRADSQRVSTRLYQASRSLTQTSGDWVPNRYCYTIGPSPIPVTKSAPSDPRSFEEDGVHKHKDLNCSNAKTEAFSI